MLKTPLPSVMSKLRLSLFMGWLAFVAGVFLPVLYVSIGNPHLGQLLFLSGSDLWQGAEVPADTVPVKGEAIGFVVITATFERMALLNPAWWFVALAGLALLCAILAPMLARMECRRPRKLVAWLLLAFGLLMLVAAVLDAHAAWAAPGYYLWLLGLLLMGLPLLVETSSTVPPTFQDQFLGRLSCRSERVP